MKYIYVVGLLVAFSVQPALAQKLDIKKRTKRNVNINLPQVRRVSPPQYSVNKGITGSLHSFQRPTGNVKQGPHRVLYTSENNLPIFIESIRTAGAARSAERKDARTGSQDYIIELKDVIKATNPNSDFAVQRVETDADNHSHVRLNQRYKNIPVYGSEVIVHLNEFAEGETFNGRYADLSGVVIDVAPTLSAQAATEYVRSDFSRGSTAHQLRDWEKKLVQFAEPVSELCVFEDKSLVSSFVLAYHIMYCPSLHKRMEYIVDANTGAILRKLSTTCHVDGPKITSANDLNGISRSINTYQKGTTFFLLDVSRTMFQPTGSVLPDDPIGGILTVDMNNTFGDNTAVKHNVSTNNAVWGDTKAVSAHFNAAFAFNYFTTKHGRNSIDDDGGTIISIINVPDENGQALDNAFWNGKAMFYGNGKTGFKALAGSVDVAGHEMTHGVVQNTANLEYQGESGAINESMADVFGVMMDPADWLIGEDVVKAAVFPSGALRSLEDPHNGGASLNDNGFQPKHVSEKYSGTEDNGGVHINSGIPNHAFFKFAEATTRDKAASVFYRALKNYLTKSSQFIDLRLAVIKAAGDLFGTSSNEVTQAGLAFDAVGIVNGQGGNYTETLPSNPGSEFMLVNTMVTTDVTLVRVQSSNGAQTSMSTTKFFSRPSVTDDGTAAVFVAEDHTIHLLITDPTKNPQETVIQDEPIWSNVVVSKGGSRIAAVTTDQEDNFIHVYDFGSEQWTDFELYNPTYTEGVNSGGPVYADALEWDYSGEYLVYDAFNRIRNADGSDIEYWDVSFIRVWDQAANDFGDGKIEKLFALLPPGVSIGNPSFSKNSPSIIAFDFIDEINEAYEILSCNIETGDIGELVINNTLGYPTFNKTDTRVAFTSDDLEGSRETNFIALNADKLSTSGDVQGLFIKTKWPVYFAAGVREIGDVVITAIGEDVTRASVTCYPNPFSDELSLKLKEGVVVNNDVEVYNLMGQRVFNVVAETSAGELKLKTSTIPAGQYVVRFKGKAFGAGCKVVKLN